MGIISPPTGRSFIFQSFFFENGCFLAVSEGSQRIGAVSVSISAASKVSTAKVIPSKNDAMFASTLSEKAASMINGICLLSIHSLKPLDLDDMKAIMGEIMDTIKTAGKSEQDGKS